MVFDALVAEENVADVGKWLLIHAMGNGLCAGTSIEEVLLAASRRDRSVVWVHPEWPVLSKFSNCAIFLALDEAATTDQVYHTVKYGALLGPLLTDTRYQST